MSIKNAQKSLRIFHNPIAAWIILFVSLIVTFLAYSLSISFVNERANDRFTYEVRSVIEEMVDRMKVYEQVLRGGVGFMYASDTVDRDEWKTYVKTLDIESNWPGIQGIGFSIPIHPEDVDSHENEIREQGFTEYRVWPEGARDLYTSIVYLEPFDWRNQRAFGYDMWSNDERRVAMTASRDEGRAIISERITLVQETKEDVQPGFLMYLPVYEDRMTPANPDERRAKFRGWVYSPFRARDLMRGILGPDQRDLKLKIYDGPTVNPNRLLYVSQEPHDAMGEPVHQSVTQIEFYGRTWTAEIFDFKGRTAADERWQSQVVASVGVVVDLLLFYLIYSIYFLNRRANEIAKEMTKELRQKNEMIEKINRDLEGTVKERTAAIEKTNLELEETVKARTEELRERIAELERVNELMVGRELQMMDLKKQIDRLKRGS